MKLTSSAKLYSSHASVVWNITTEEVTEKEQQYSKRPRKKRNTNTERSLERDGFGRPDSNDSRPIN